VPAGPVEAVVQREDGISGKGHVGCSQSEDSGLPEVGNTGTGAGEKGWGVLGVPVRGGMGAFSRGGWGGSSLASEKLEDPKCGVSNDFFSSVLEVLSEILLPNEHQG